MQLVVKSPYLFKIFKDLFARFLGLHAEIHCMSPCLNAYLPLVRFAYLAKPSTHLSQSSDDEMLIQHFRQLCPLTFHGYHGNYPREQRRWQSL